LFSELTSHQEEARVISMVVQPFRDSYLGRNGERGERAGVRTKRMISTLIKRLVINNRAFILQEVLAVKGLMHLLMKIRNTEQPWTKDEKKEIKKHLRNISKMVPVIIIFLLPGGTLFLPFLSEVLDRRKTKRRPPQSSPP
jgi:hypothetical protein